jgi:hypothetical protein
MLHNTPPEVLLKHCREIREAEVEQKKASAALRNARKAAKNAGIDLEALRLAEKLMKRDVDEATVTIRHTREYLAYLESPIGTQFDMFGGAPTPEVPDQVAYEHKVWQAGQDGAECGRKGGLDDENPHGQGTELYAAWARGYARGRREFLDIQTTIADEMAPETPKRGRGRPRKNAAAIVPQVPEYRPTEPPAPVTYF